MAKKQDKGKYIKVTKHEDNIDPRCVFPPLKKETEAIQSLVGKRKYFTLYNKLDKHRYFQYRTKIKSLEEDLWVCGDSFCLNQNPKHKLIIRSLCMKTKKPCAGFEGDVHNEFFSICPHCNHIFVGVKDVKVQCDYCHRHVDCSDRDNLKWIKYSCVNCPVDIGLDEANLNLDYALNNQYSRQEIHQGMEVKDEQEESEES